MTTLSAASLAAHVRFAGVALEKSTPSIAVSLIVVTIALAAVEMAPIRLTVRLTLPSFSRTDADGSFQPTRTTLLMAASNAPRASSRPTPQVAVVQLLPLGKPRAPARMARRV